MNDPSYLDLAKNAALLLALALVFDTAARQTGTYKKLWVQLVLGLITGMIGVLIMNTPWSYGKGLFFDTRSILLSLTGLFFGPIPAILAIVMTAVFRFTQGGAYLTGISVIVATGLAGIGAHYRFRKSLISLKWWQFYFFGVIVHVLMLALMFTQHINIALPLLQKITLPIMTIYPVTSMLLGMLIVNRLKRDRAFLEIEQNKERLKSMVDILQYSAESTQEFVDFAMEEAIRLTESQLGFIFYYTEESQEFTLSAWSKGAWEQCSIPEPQRIYQLEKTGLWGEPVRQRKPIVINNYPTEKVYRKGFPQGHPAIQRLLEIPIFSDANIVAVVGMANKESDYNDTDVAQLTLLMDLVWKTTERRKAVEELRKSEENYRLLFDQAADGIFITTSDGHFLAVNHSGCKMLGYSQEEISQQFTKIFRNVDESLNQAKTLDMIKKNGSLITERKLQTKNGQWITSEIMTSFLPDGRMQKVVRNISERKENEAKILQAQKELEELLKTSDDSRKALLSVIEDQKEIEDALRNSETSYRNLFENITQGFALHKIIVDQNNTPVDYQFVAINPAYEKITGLKANDLKHKKVREVLPGIEQKWIDTYGHVALSGEPIHFEDFTATLNKHFEVSAFCPEIGYFAVIVTDITKRKQYELEIQRFNQILEQRVQERTQELENANHELESFSYSVSHDLRAPLRSINGFTEIILDEHKEKLDPELSHYFELIRKNSAMMGCLVDDLLSFSRLGKQEINKIGVDPNLIVREVLETLQQEISARNIKIIALPLPRCSADFSLLRQVYMNLVSNAVKFSRAEEGACVEIGSFESREDQNAELTYYVKDNGVGFDMKYYDKLFGVFQRLHRSEEYEGTGVGLAIVDRIVKKHGGKIWAESNVSRGTTFYFTIGEPK